MEQYDAWGQPINPQDTHRTYPSGHTDTLVPAVNQAIQTNRKSKIPQFKGFGQQVLIAGCILGGFWVLSILLTLGSRQSVATPQIELEPIVPIEETLNPEPPPLNDLTSRRANAWEAVRQACGVDLISTANSTDTEVRSARADSWLLYAKQQCDADPGCGSPYDWLRQQLDERGARIQRIALADRLPVRAKEVLEYRTAQADLLDIAKALSSGVNARSLSWVPADRLSDSIDECSSAAKRFESLTRAAIEDASMFPGGDDAF